MSVRSARKRVLIIEDERKIAQLLIDYMEQADFETQWISNGMQVMSEFATSTPDLVFLDLMLPGKDGMQLCREIRAISDTPIIMITARIEEVDRLLGLELGADDYVCKPFSPREVVARAKAILRRTDRMDRAVGTGPFAVDTNRMTIHLDDKPLSLTHSEFKLLVALVARPGHVFSREQLLNAAGDGLLHVSDRAIDSHIKNLRKKIAMIRPAENLLASVYGVGYRLDLA